MSTFYSKLFGQHPKGCPQHHLVKLQPLCQAAAKAFLHQLHHKSGHAKCWQCGCRWPLTAGQFMRSDQYVGHCLLWGILTSGQWKKLPPLKVKRLKFSRPNRSVSGCWATHLIPVARREKKRWVSATNLQRLGDRVMPSVSHQELKWLKTPSPCSPLQVSEAMLRTAFRLNRALPRTGKS